MRGAFITFEGGEGAGKSTQAQRLARRLEAAGKDVVLSREPGGSPFAEKLRAALIGPRGAGLSPTDQAILFAAARADHVDTVIAPALAEGRWVVCDRFADSTEAYQGAAGASGGLISVLRQVTVGDREPDLTIVLDLAPAVGLERARERRSLDPFEKHDLHVQSARREAFLAIARREPARCVVIDASVDPDTIAETVWQVVRTKLLAEPVGS